jgi:hypothetical protein
METDIHPYTHLGFFGWPEKVIVKPPSQRLYILHMFASILMVSTTSTSSACSYIPSLPFYSLSLFFTFILFNFTAGQFFTIFDQDHIQPLGNSS